MATMSIMRVDGDKLRRLREDRLLSRAELGEAAGIHAEHVARLERGLTKSPRMATIRGLAKALGVEASEFTVRD